MKKILYIPICALLLMPLVGAFAFPSLVHAADPVCGTGEHLVKSATSHGGPGQSAPEGKCVTDTGWFDAIWTGFKRIIATSILFLSAAILFMAGILLNYSVQYTIVEATRFINTDIVSTAWATFRDLANIFFIFVLIYISISTILNLKSRASREILVRIIIVALLINFSLFFTKVIVDVSNVLTLQFYTPLASQSGDPIKQGISWTFMKPMFVASIVNVDQNGNIGLKSAEEILGNDTSSQNIFTIGLMGSLFILIAAFVFIAAALFLIIRFVIIIFLLVTSPLAYIASILPKAAGYSSKWWGALFDQMIFAPVMMMLLWFVSKLIYSPAFQELVGGANPTTGTFNDAIISGKAGPIMVIFNFLIIIVLLVASIIVAKKAGAAGGSGVTNFAGKFSFGAAGWIGRNTLGAGAFNLSKRLEKTQFATTRAGRAVLQSTRGVAGSSFDLRSSPLGTAAKTSGADLGKAGGKGGFTKAREEEVKAREKYGKSLSGSRVFADPAVKERYEDLTHRNENDRKTLESLGAQISQLKVKPSKTPVDLAQIQSLEDSRAKTANAVREREKEIKTIESDRGIFMTGQAAYASNLAGAGQFGKEATTGARVANALSWISLRRSAQKEASKKIRDSMKKKPEEKLADAFKKYQEETGEGGAKREEGTEKKEEKPEEGKEEK